jgi:hypothetical protein
VSKKRGTFKPDVQEMIEKLDEISNNVFLEEIFLITNKEAE